MIGSLTLGQGAIVGLIMFVIYLGVFGAMLWGMWKVFEKMGRKGWEGIVPIYNIYILLQIFNKPIWWLVLLLVPIANFVVLILLCIELAKSFGKTPGYGVGLALLGPVFFPLLAYSPATFTPPVNGRPALT
jgi:hypothetical protein